MVNINNKRGWLRIVEALVSILIVFGAVLTVVSSNRAGSDDFCSMLPPLLQDISQDVNLRQQILAGQTGGVNAFLKERIRNPSLDYRTKICKACLEENSCTPQEELCTQDLNGANYLDVCASERVISSVVDESNPTKTFAPQKLKVYLLRYSR